MRGPRFLTVVFFGFLGMLALTVTPSTQSRRNNAVDTSLGYPVVAREVIVKLRQPESESSLRDLERDANAESVQTVGQARALQVRSRSLDVADLIDRLRGRADVLYVEPNYFVHAWTAPNDPGFPLLWGLENIGQAVNGGLPGVAGADIDAVDGWDIALGSTAHVVAVIDTGIDYTHPDLVPNLWSAPATFTVTVGNESVTCPAGSHGFNALEMSCDPWDDHFHGTHVSGTIGAAGNNGLGVTGVNWTTRIMALKFLDNTGSGSIADAIKTLQFASAVRQHFAPTGNTADIRVLSASWGGSEFSQALADEIAAAGEDEMLFVAAAGNQGLNNDFFAAYPASFDVPSIVSVAATTSTDGRAWFSNYGATTVDLGAPGANIYSTMPGATYGYLDGTSMATPHVSGAAALVLSRCDVDTPTLKDILLGSVTPVAGLTGLTVTGGRLNVNSALHSCIAPPEVPTNLSAHGGDGQVTLSWSAALGATGYHVKRSLTTGGPYTIIAPDVKGAGYTDTAVINGTTYYYVVSAVNTLGESADSNEAFATPSQPSDLIVSSLSVPTEGDPGDTIDIAVTTRNQGSNAAPASVTRFYLSLNTTLDASDPELTGQQDVPPLAAGAEASTVVSSMLPTELPAGAYWVIAKANADDQVNEVYTFNNLRVDLIKIGPDLSVSYLSVPSSAAAGTDVTVDDTVINRGGGHAAASVNRYYLSSDTLLSADDELLVGGRSVPELAAGESNSGTATVTMPDTLGTGTLYLIAKADGDETVGEVFENNNTRARSIEVGADLTVASLSAPYTSGAGDWIDVSTTIENRGSNTAAPSVVRFYLSANGLLDANDTELEGSRSVGTLAGGETSTGSTLVRLPDGLASASYYLLAQADADDVVFETRENNNTKAKGVSIGPDLRVTVLVLPLSVAKGSTVTATDTVKNTGGGAAGSSTTRFYLSINYILDAGDVLLDGSRLVAPVAPLGTDIGSTILTIPSNTQSGKYYVIAVTDADGDVDERYETNNTGVRLITVTN